MDIANRVIEHFGSKRAAADAFGLHRETLRLWQHHGVPLQRALDIERLTQGAITAEEILSEAKKAALAA